MTVLEVTPDLIQILDRAADPCNTARRGLSDLEDCFVDLARLLEVQVEKQNKVPEAPEND